MSKAFSVCQQLYIDAQYTNMKLPLDIVIGTVPLRETFRSLPAPQFQGVVTEQPPSAPPMNQPDGDNFDLGMFLMVPLMGFNASLREHSWRFFTVFRWIYWFVLLNFAKAFKRFY